MQESDILNSQAASSECFHQEQTARLTHNGQFSHNKEMCKNGETFSSLQTVILK
jgi:hypothetical protein